MGRNNILTDNPSSALGRTGTAQAHQALNSHAQPAAMGIAALARATLMTPAGFKSTMPTAGKGGAELSAPTKYVPPALRGGPPSPSLKLPIAPPPVVTTVAPVPGAATHRPLSPKSKNIQAKPTWRPKNNDAKLDRLFSAGPVARTGNAKLYRATRPAAYHPDDDFTSGAWLFDAARTPLWMQRECPSTATALVLKRRNLACPVPTFRARSRRANLGVAAPRLAFGNTAPVGRVIPLGAVRARRATAEDAVTSGAWLFHGLLGTPAWFRAAMMPAAKAAVPMQAMAYVKRPATLAAKAQQKQAPLVAKYRSATAATAEQARKAAPARAAR
ncbi:hypothetical protein H9P43_000638 [Blastocladiella emersonii ATCC 22665]|nr:hypothetical protein H9P43_000638 [Blastocladiella emersonii ATCC 22665]